MFDSRSRRGALLGAGVLALTAGVLVLQGHRDVSTTTARGASNSLAFEPLDATWDGAPDYVARTANGFAGVASNGAVLRIAGSRGSAPRQLRFEFEGARQGLKPSVAGRLPGVSHYYSGSDESKWRRDVPRYGRVSYSDVYRGIDVAFYGTGRSLEYDFIVKPGADLDAIAIDVQGGDLRLSKSGDLHLGPTADATVQRAPIAYQVIDGARRVIASGYRLLGRSTVGFWVGPHDRSRPLVIDPIVSYSSYLGGEAWDSSAALAVNTAGDTFLAGNTNSLQFAWQPQMPTSFSGVYDAYVCRSNASGGTPYCAYFGGTGDDAAWAVAVGKDGAPVIGGYTESLDFPIRNAYQTANRGGGDAFVLKLDPSGREIQYATYFGGNAAENIRGIATAPDGSMYVTGGTDSTGYFPVTSGAYATGHSGGSDAFIGHFDANGALLQASYFGGPSYDQGRGITVDAAGTVYLTGNTYGALPMKGGVQMTYGGNGDGFLAKFDSALSQLQYATYHGGSGTEWAYGVKVDRAGNTVFAGTTTSTDMPVVSRAWQTTSGGDTDSFVVKLDPTGAKRLASTYMGAAGYDDFREIELDPAGNIYLAGYTRSPNFVVVASPTTLATSNGTNDSALVVFDPLAQNLLRSMPFGGSGDEVNTGFARSIDGVLHFSGWTQSTDFLLAGAFQTNHASPADSDPNTADQADIYLTRLSETSEVRWSGDFDGDGADDILWRNRATGAQAVWPRGDYTRRYNLSTITDLNWQIAAVGDFNGDGRDDILWRQMASGSNTIWLSGNRGTQQPVTAVPDMNWIVAGVGDFDGDGRADILWHSRYTTANGIWRHADSTSTLPVSNIADRSWYIAAVGNFDSDGFADVLWHNEATGKNLIWPAADAIRRRSAGTVPGYEMRVVGAADFNGDGIDDLLWRNARSGVNAIWRAGNAATQQAVTAASAHQLRVVGTGDYNGDGRADILWRNVVTGTNVAWLAGNRATPLPVTAVTDQNWSPKG